MCFPFRIWWKWPTTWLLETCYPKIIGPVFIWFPPLKLRDYVFYPNLKVVGVKRGKTFQYFLHLREISHRWGCSAAGHSLAYRSPVWIYIYITATKWTQLHLTCSRLEVEKRSLTGIYKVKVKLNKLSWQHDCRLKWPPVICSLISLETHALGGTW